MHSGPISSRFAVMSTNGLAQLRVVFKTCLNYLSSNSKSRETLDFYLPFILPLVVHKRQMTSKHFFSFKNATRIGWTRAEIFWQFRLSSCLPYVKFDSMLTILKTESSPSLSFFLPLSLYIYISISIYLSISITLFLSPSLYLSLSFSLSLYLSLFFSLSTIFFVFDCDNTTNNVRVCPTFLWLVPRW